MVTNHYDLLGCWPMYMLNLNRVSTCQASFAASPTNTTSVTIPSSTITIITIREIVARNSVAIRLASLAAPTSEAPRRPSRHFNHDIVAAIEQEVKAHKQQCTHEQLDSWCVL